MIDFAARSCRYCFAEINGKGQAVMKNLTLENIAKACGGKLYGDGTDGGEVTGVTLDSRQAESGCLFIATRGERVDGHSFIPQALRKGAAGVVCERLPETEGAEGRFILVENSFQALKDIAKFYREQLDVTVVGVTGSVGKTSTKECIASVLSERYCVCKTEGNFNNEVGLPLTVLNIREEHEIAVLEMGISDFGEMHRLSEIARPDICVLTNIGQCHLENLKSREGILRAKTEIFDFMKDDGLACINGDDDMLETIGEVRGRKPMTFGRRESNRVYAESVESRGLFGSRVLVHLDDEEFYADVPLPGEHMVYNALAAVSVGSLLGMTAEEMRQGIAKTEAVGGRSRIVETGEWTVIDDCYNANPVSVRAAIDLLGTALTRKAAVLGDMFELGEDEKEMHAGIGAYAAEQGIDVLVFIGSLAEDMYRGAVRTAENLENPPEGVYYFREKQEFLARQREILRPQDTVLVKASHGMAFREIVEALEAGKNEV